ncbi:MAG: lipopolysaccharide heptosyltransferase II [Nitrospirota bacterium]
MNGEQYNNILIVKPSSLGDVVHAMPFLSALRKRFPDAYISWVVNKGLEPLFDGVSELNDLIIFDRYEWRDTIFHFIRDLRKRRFDVVIDLQCLLRSGIFSFLSGASVRIGLGDGREGSRFFYTHIVDIPDTPMHSVERYMLCAEYLDAGTDKRDFLLRVTEEEKAVGRKLFGIKEKEFVIVNPGGRWTTKRWLPSGFASIIDYLERVYGIRSVIIGTEEEMSIADEIVSASKIAIPIMATGKTSLRELIALISESSFIIANDTGPMHIASALGIPVIVIFGPTNPLKTGPYGDKHTVIKADVECAPCFKKHCEDMRCMKYIASEEVIRKIDTQIQT